VLAALNDRDPVYEDVMDAGGVPDRRLICRPIGYGRQVEEDKIGRAARLQMSPVQNTELAARIPGHLPDGGWQIEQTPFPHEVAQYPREGPEGSWMRPTMTERTFVAATPGV
jgi:hypothetical protein